MLPSLFTLSIIKLFILFPVTGSSPEVGSSKISISGSSIALAIATLFAFLRVVMEIGTLWNLKVQPDLMKIQLSPLIDSTLKIILT